MKINAVSTNYSVSKRNSLKNEGDIKNSNSLSSNRMAIISFKGGNKEQAIEWCVENNPYFQNGGVATAINDRRTLRVSEKDPIITDAMRANINHQPLKSKAFAMPLYNGKLVYNSESGIIEKVEVPRIPTGLPDDSPFKKYEGKPCLINHPKFQKYLDEKEFFEKEGGINKITKRPNLNLNKNVFILEDVTGQEKRMMDFGATNETEIKLYRVLWEKDGKLIPTNDFHVFTDVTASWPKPYSEGGYATNSGALGQTWKGNGDARAAKAFVEFKPRICEVLSQNGEKFEPATIVCNDSQASYCIEYMAQKAANGEEAWKDVKPTVIGHNMGDGYIGKTSYMNMFVNIADKDLRQAVEKDPKYIEALKQGESKVNEYFAELIPDVMKDAQGSVSPFKNAIYYAKLGYVPTISSVSEPYVTKVVTDPNFAPAIYSDLKELHQKGSVIGIINSLEAAMNPYDTKGPDGYYAIDYEFPDGIEINGQKNYKISKMSAFDKNLVNETSVDINHVREVKRLNKIALFERLDKNVLEKLKELKNVKGHQNDLSTLIAGLADKNVEVSGYIDRKYLDAVRQPNSDVKLITSWGRGDTQKALDTVIEAFEKYVKGPGKNDKNSVLVMGGALSGSPDEKKILDLIERVSNDPEIKGRFVYLNGFAPNKPLASAADFAMFPSRFAPCELTDLEAMKLFCAPIVTDCQGLAQKNFDELYANEKERVTGYKAKHEYFTSMEELRNALPETSSDKNIRTRKQLDEAIKKFKNSINEEYRLKHGGKLLSDAQIDEMLLKDGGLNYKYNFEILRPFRDQVVAEDLSTCLERALITDRNKEVQTRMVENHIKQYTDWERNGKLSATGRSSAQLYREAHFQKDGKPVKKSETLLEKLRARCAELGVFDRIENQSTSSCNNSEHNINSGLINWLKKNKKTAIITGSVVAAAGLAFAGNKAGWFSSKESDSSKHLSAVG